MGLKSIEEHNRERREARAEAERTRGRTGVACPSCGRELSWKVDPYAALTWPALSTSAAYCLGCCLSVELER